ncbi:MAG: transketolase family protein [Armatimonadetes bacterium]|nr:transketolase family protein [Armatimonadota bacterium]
MPEKIATRDAYGEALVELGKKNPNVVVLDADLSKSTKTNLFSKAFPNRHFNMGVAEANMISTAAGLATCGKIPFASTFAVFASGRVWDQVRMSVCYPELNVKIVATHGGITVGEDGASHQANEDIAIMRALPNITVIVPADAVETKKAVMAIADFEGPVYMRLGRSAVPVVFDDSYDFQIGEAVIVRPGDDVSIFACGIMLAEALEAAESLVLEGISAEVVNVSTIKPLDTETILGSVRKTECAVAAEEHSVIGGLGSAIAEVLIDAFPVPLERVGLPDTFGESGKPHELLAKYCMTSSDIASSAKLAIKHKRERR